MYENELKKYARDILDSPNFRSTRGHIQHGNMSVNEHCINVAKTSLYIRNKLGIRCNTRDLVRGHCSMTIFCMTGTRVIWRRHINCMDFFILRAP